MLNRRKKIEPSHEPPAVLLVDVAFNLLIFFVVCASTEPQDGRKQEIPGSQQKADQVAQQAENIEIALTRTTVSINGLPVKQTDFQSKLTSMLAGKKTVEEKIVVVKSTPDTSYEHWIQVTGLIEQAGGVTTLQLEEQRQVQVQ